MQQTVTLIVACNAPGRELFRTAKRRLSPTGFTFDPVPLLKGSQLAFYLTYLDVWSMCQSFEKFLYPRSEVKYYEKGSTMLWAIRREKLRLRNKPMNEEEAIFLSMLQHARQTYRRATDESYLFIVRSVFAGSIGFNPALGWIDT